MYEAVQGNPIWENSSQEPVKVLGTDPVSIVRSSTYRIVKYIWPRSVPCRLLDRYEIFLTVVLQQSIWNWKILLGKDSKKQKLNEISTSQEANCFKIRVIYKFIYLVVLCVCVFIEHMFKYVHIYTYPVTLHMEARGHHRKVGSLFYHMG